MDCASAMAAELPVYAACGAGDGEPSTQGTDRKHATTAHEGGPLLHSLAGPQVIGGPVDNPSPVDAKYAPGAVIVNHLDVPAAAEAADAQVSRLMVTVVRTSSDRVRSNGDMTDAEVNQEWKELNNEAHRYLRAGGKWAAVGRHIGALAYSGMPSAMVVRQRSNRIVLVSGGSWDGVCVGRSDWNRKIGAVLGCVPSALMPIRLVRSLPFLDACFVGFAYPGSRETLNFGQGADRARLEDVYACLRRAHPTAEIILYASCLGALRVLNWLAFRAAPPTGLKAMILSEPLISFRAFFGFFGCIARPSYALVCSALPSFRAPDDAPARSWMAVAAARFPDIPLLMGFLPGDAIGDARNGPLIAAKFAPPRTRTFLHPTAGLFHGRLISTREWATAIRDFYIAIVSPHPAPPTVIPPCAALPLALPPTVIPPSAILTMALPLPANNSAFVNAQSTRHALAIYKFVF
jgi:hypothetical protein